MWGLRRKSAPSPQPSPPVKPGERAQKARKVEGCLSEAPSLLASPGERVGVRGCPYVARTTNSTGNTSDATVSPWINPNTLRANSVPPSCQSWRTELNGGMKLAASGMSS